MAEVARLCINDIRRSICSRASAIQDPWLLAQLATFESYATTLLGEEDLSRELLSRAVKGLRSLRTEPSLFGGFTGVAWIADHLASRNRIAVDNNCEIDEALLTYLEKPRWSSSYDLIGGLVGIGVYGVERVRTETGRECLRQVIRHLAELAESAPPGVSWRTSPWLIDTARRRDAPNGYFDLGIAHGVAGVIGVLSQAQTLQVSDLTMSMLRDGVAWLLAQKLPQGSGATFPYIVGDLIDVQPSRTAWCYGDAGIASVLLLAAQSAGQQEWRREAIEIGRSAAARSSTDCNVVDAGVCHGTAGLGHLFNRMFQATGEPDFQQAAVRWLASTLEMHQSGGGLGGYVAWDRGDSGQLAWVLRDDILTGLCGVGLVLLAAIGTEEPAWDRLLLVSPIS